jgi:hypothetical protein
MVGGCPTSGDSDNPAINTAFDKTPLNYETATLRNSAPFLNKRALEKL